MLHIERSLKARRRLAAGLATIAAAMLVTACGLRGHHDDDQGDTPPVVQQPPPVSNVDAFIAFVQTVVGSVSESTEPVAIDSVAVTTPENTEPVPVQ